ncbi:MAG: head-tail adaptor protein [Deltaproteobacteria bacterium]|nr:head-tail adaptor protein [Deltaproteobacteria bacterium]
MIAMNPGAMRDSLPIYARRSVQNESGYAQAQETLVCVLRGRRAWVNDREIWEAHAAQAKSVITWECRYHKDVRPGLWVKWQGQWQEIIAVQLPPGVPLRMILKTAQKQAK